MARRLPESLLALVLGVTALLYLPVLSANFVGFDDFDYVRDNPLVRQLDVLRTLSPRTLTLSDWTPLVTLTYALEHKLWGSAAQGYHAVNLALHLLSMVLLYGLLRDLGFGPYPSLLATLLFGIHPLQVESVAWISSRKNLLAAVFGLAFFRAYLANRLPLALLFLLLAGGSKGTAVTFPAWAIAATLLGFGRVRAKQALPWLVAFGILGGLRVAASVGAQAPVIGSGAVGHMSVATRMSITGRVFVRQLRQFFLPYDLEVVYFWSPAAWSDPAVLGAWILLAVLAAALLWRARRDAKLGLALALLAMALLPTSNLFPAPAFQADRYAHLPMVGAALVLVVLLEPAFRARARLTAVALFAWCALVLLPKAHGRITAWRDTETLWAELVRTRPDFLFAWNNLATYYLESQDLGGAEKALRHILVLEPQQVDAQLNLGLLLTNTHRNDEAEQVFRSLLAQQPNRARAHAAFAHLLSEIGRRDEARAELDRALALDPEHSPTRYQRAKLLESDGLLDEAAEDLSLLLQSSSASLLRLDLARIRLRQGRGQESARLAREVTDRDPANAEARRVLDEALAAAGQADVAGP